MADRTFVRKKGKHLTVEQRVRIDEQLSMGKKQKQVAEMFGISQQTVSLVIKRFRETGSFEKKPYSPRKKPVRSKKNISKVKKIFFFFFR